MGNVEKTDKNIVSFEFSVSPEEFEKAVQKAYKKNVKKINMPGFRKGKAPRIIIEKAYGKEVFYEDAINFVLPDAYDKAVEENGISPVAQPEIDLKSEKIEPDKEIIFTAKVVVKPEFELGEYKGVKAEKAVYETTDENVNEDIKNNLIENINKEIDDNYNKHTAIKHYKDTYNFIPPFVLNKVLTFGTISRYYGLLKQNDRQDISKYFKISDKLLKQILANLTMIRNIAAHSDRLFCYRNKYYISFKNIDKNYKRTGNFTNIYMIIQCMKILLDEEKFKEFENLFNIEVNKLKEKLNSININDILRIMGFNV